MLTVEEQKKIYGILREQMEIGEETYLATVGNKLAALGFDPMDYGFTKLRELFAALPFVTVKELEVPAGYPPRQSVILKSWSPEGADGAAISAPDEAFAHWKSCLLDGFGFSYKIRVAYCTMLGVTEDVAREEILNAFETAYRNKTIRWREDGGFTFVVPRAVALVMPNKLVDGHYFFSFQPREGEGIDNRLGEQGGQGKEAAPFHSTSPALSEADKKCIYQALREIFPAGEPVHLAKLNIALREADCSKERFGFSKVRQLLEALPEFISLEEKLMNGVPQILVTIHPMPQWDKAEGEEAPAQTVPFAAESLPEHLEGKVNFVPKTLAKLSELIAKEVGRAYEPERLIALVEEGYERAKDDGQLHLYRDVCTIPLGLQDTEGREIVASIKRADFGDYPWFLNFAGVATWGASKAAPGKMLEQFAYLGPWPLFLEKLADKALPESWDFADSPVKNHFILRQYILYTFYRLQLEDKVCISEEEGFAAFNTGLVTPHFDDIYACFDAVEGEKSHWRFVDFCTAAARGIGKKLVDCFNPLPQPASYFERKEDLLFDLEKELHTDYEHILLDNISRLPLDFLKEECHGIADAMAYVEQLEGLGEDWHAKKACYQEFSDFIADTPRLFNRLRNRLEDAIKLARKQVRWNYKTAIPSYFPTRNVMSLMLPLSLLQQEGQADVALVVELTRSGNYQGQTILTLQQAYLDSRLLCRPNSEWLDTQSIHSEQESDDENE